MKIIEGFASKIYVFPGIIKEIEGKGRGLIASRDIKENEIVANYSGRLISQAETTAYYPNSGYLFNFQ
jgi:SET domain-containing protein